MKRLLLYLLLLNSAICHAQNYECLQAGVKNYFVNSNGYLREIRIDSVRTMGSAVAYYPFHTTRGVNYGFPTYATLDTNTGSWLGKTVLKLSDGTFLFDNMWQDTIVIRTQAQVGDSWIFYNDTTPQYYRATVVSADTMTVAGIVDSIKTISISAYNTGGPDPANPLNNFRIVLSKNHGFADVFDLYTFPYRRPDTVGYSSHDYYQDYIYGITSFGMGTYTPTATISQFSQALLVNPTYTQLYDWHAGDVFENSNYNWNIPNDGSYPYGYYFDSITSKTIVAGGTQFNYSGWQATQHIDPFLILSGTVNPSFNYPYDTMSTTGSFTVSNAALFDTTLMPEEKGQPYLQYYLRADTSFCYTGAVYKFIRNDIQGNRCQPIGEGGGPYLSYKTGIGLLNYDVNVLGGSPPLIDDTTLLYYVKSGLHCGHYTVPFPIYIPTSVTGPVKNNTTIYPNPASTEITITSNDKIGKVVITDLVGRVILTKMCNTEMVVLNVADLRPGMYLIRVNDPDSYRGQVSKFVKR